MAGRLLAAESGFRLEGLDAVGYVVAAVWPGHVHILVREAPPEVLAIRVDGHLLKPVQLLIILDGALARAVGRHRDIVDAHHVPRVVVGRWYQVPVRVRPMETAAHLRGDLDGAEMTALERGHFLIDRLLRRLVLLQIAGAGRLPVAVDELVEVDHALVVATQFEEEEGGEAGEHQEDQYDECAKDGHERVPILLFLHLGQCSFARWWHLVVQHDVQVAARVEGLGGVASEPDDELGIEPPHKLHDGRHFALLYEVI